MGGGVIPGLVKDRPIRAEHGHGRHSLEQRDVGVGPQCQEVLGDIPWRRHVCHLLGDPHKVGRPGHQPADVRFTQELQDGALVVVLDDPGEHAVTAIDGGRGVGLDNSRIGVRGHRTEGTIVHLDHREPIRVCEGGHLRTVLSRLRDGMLQVREVEFSTEDVFEFGLELAPLGFGERGEGVNRVKDRAGLPRLLEGGE